MNFINVLFSTYTVLDTGVLGIMGKDKGSYLT